MTETMATSFDRVRKMQINMQRYGSVKSDIKSQSKKFQNFKYLLQLPSLQKTPISSKLQDDYSPSDLSYIDKQTRILQRNQSEDEA